MYPPLPPFSVHPQQPHNFRHHRHAMPHYVQAATMRMPLQAWQPHDSYGNNFVIMPSHHQPLAPWKPTGKPHFKKTTRTVAVTATKVVKTEKTEKTGKSMEEDKKENEKRIKLKEDNQAEHDAVTSVVTTTTAASAIKPADAIAWPQDPAVVLFVTTPEQIKSIWSTTPLELSSMMLLARHGQLCSRKPQEKASSHTRSNQETHEISSSSSSDSSVDDASSTDTEDEDVPVLKRYYSLQALELFPCDADYDTRSTSQSSKPRDDAESKARLIFPSPSNTFEAPDYRKLFGLAADAAPFCPSSTPSSDTSADMNEGGIPPPHMMWWPGDWKCSNCGNHNFSYRDTCKRCREGRIVEAGFIFTIPPC